MKKMTKQVLSFVMALVIVVGTLPLTAIAEGSSVTNYDDFIAELKVLETYADEYAKAVQRDPGELVLNFIRTGVERYQDSEWTTLAGQEITGFTNYVKEQDNANGTTVMKLRNIVTNDFILPNGNQADFGHMFGCMNISYVNKGSADLSGWAGDLCDLLYYCARDTIVPTGSVEEMADYIRENCFGEDASEAFGWDDFWGDMDAYYLITEYSKANGEKKFSQIMETYFLGLANDVDGDTKLTDTDRTAYFMNNRFGVEDSKEAVRKAIFDAYSSDVGIKILESKRGLSSLNALREACCYAIADYIYENATGYLVEGVGGGETAANGYYSVFSNDESVLAPGITQNIKYAQTVDGKQIVYYVATVDVNRDDVMIMANYKDNDPSKGWGLQTVMDQTNALVKNYKDKYEYFTPVVATNGDGYNIYNGTPGGLLIMDGIEYHPVDKDGFFAILSDGSAIIGTQAEYAQYKDQIKEAIGGFGAVLVKDGKINVTKNANYTASRASRTAVGITADGKVVMMVLDGRQQPFSAGGSMEEIAQIMLEAGCVHAINLDGGGSTTYLSKPAGSDNIQLVNRPSDGYQRMVAVSLVAVSTAKPSNEFDKAIISSDYEYITAGTSMKFGVTGVSNTGNAAVIPAGATWRVSDETLATIDENGVFTALANGEVTVEFVVNGEVKGSKVINIVIPDDIKFVEDRITAIYGEPKEIGVTVWYQGNPVAFTALREAFVFFDYSFDQYGNPDLSFTSDAGYINGLEFVGSDAKGVRTVTVYAALMIGKNIIATTATINLYYADEATFDFDNATSGNRALAWLREIENARTTDNKFYRVIDPTKPIKIDYTFALDMTAIEMPAQLEPLKSMLPDGTNPDAAAWDFLLSLAERICVQTNVTIRVELSPELDVDISNLKIVTDYFELTSVNLDENNVLTMVCNWKDQTAAIDPATANPLCLLTGISATVKDSASYFNNEVVITNNGTVTYDIYLATSALHSFASDPANQAQYGLYPYEHSDEKYPNGCRGEDHDTGGHFSSQYLDFADVYVASKEILEGWQEEDGEYYFYKNNIPVTGTQLVTDRKDATKLRFYEFDENGKLINEQGANGLIWLGEDLYYAILGEAQTGWQTIDDNSYYFHPDTGKAVDGVVQIRERVYPGTTDPTMATYTYTFTNHILTRGDLRANERDGSKIGIRYRWAGDWKKACWFEVDGNTYHVTKNYPYFVTTGYAHYIINYPDSEDTRSYLFDENGVLQKNFTGAATVNVKGTERTLFFKNGEVYTAFGLIQGDDGYYYYVNNNQENGSWVDGVVITNQQFKVTVNRGHGYITEEATYTFDDKGRMVEPLVTVNQQGISAEVSVMGRAVTVEYDLACVLICKVGNTYVAIQARANGDGTYNFTVPQDATDVQLVVKGDANGDGVVGQEDMDLLTAYLLGEAELTAEQLLILDVNGNGKVNSADKTLLARALLAKDHKAYKALEW